MHRFDILLEKFAVYAWPRERSDYAQSAGSSVPPGIVRVQPSERVWDAYFNNQKVGSRNQTAMHVKKLRLISDDVFHMSHMLK